MIRLDAPRWQALRAARGDSGRWLHLRIGALHADRLSWLPASDAPATGAPATAAAEPAPAARDRDRRREHRRAARRRADGDAGARPARPRPSRQRRRRAASLRRSRRRLRPRPHRRLGIDRRRRAVRGPRSTRPRAPSTRRCRGRRRVGADGPLEALAARVQARVAASASHAAQALDARAVVRPFAAWPLGELQATTEALDLSVFASAAPATALSGRAVVTTSGIDRPAVVSLDLRQQPRRPLERRPAAGHPPRRRAARAAGRARARSRCRRSPPSSARPSAAAARSSAAANGAGDRWNVDRRARAASGRRRSTRARPTSRSRARRRSSAAASRGAAEAAVGRDHRRTRRPVRRSRACRRRRRAAPACASTRPPRPTRSRCASPRPAPARHGRASPASWCAARARRHGARAARSSSPTSTRPVVAGQRRLAAGARPEPDRRARRVRSRAARPPTLPLYDALAATRGSASLALARKHARRRRRRRRCELRQQRRPRPAGVRSGRRRQPRARPGAARGARRQRRRLAARARRAGSSIGSRRGLLPRGRQARATAIAGALTAKAHVEGRWPSLRATGELHGAGLRYRTLALRRAEGRWQLGSDADAPLDGDARARRHRCLGPGDRARRACASSGTARAHRGELRIESAALPPEWADALAARAPAPAAAAPAARQPASVRRQQLRRRQGLREPRRGRQRPQQERPRRRRRRPRAAPSSSSSKAAWSMPTASAMPAGAAACSELLVQSLAAPARTWLRARDLRGDVVLGRWPGAGEPRPGSAEALGAALRWSRVAWQARRRRAHAGRLDAQASSIRCRWRRCCAAAARFRLGRRPRRRRPHRRAQRADGRGRRRASNAPRGDLTVTDEIGNAGARPHRPAARHRRAGRRVELHRGARRQRRSAWLPAPSSARTSRTARRGRRRRRRSRACSSCASPTSAPGAPGCRRAGASTGALHASASIGGRFGAPEYTGQVDGTRPRRAQLPRKASTCATATWRSPAGRRRARIERFSAQAPATARVALEGGATFGDAPTARLKLIADTFAGARPRRPAHRRQRPAPQLQLDATTIALDGNFKVDEGLVDFTRSDAPQLGDDVGSCAGRGASGAAGGAAPRRRAAAPRRRAGGSARSRSTCASTWASSCACAAAASTPACAASCTSRRRTAGSALNGTCARSEGTYAAYGQKLGDRSRRASPSPARSENPRLDIEATRPEPRRARRRARRPARRWRRACGSSPSPRCPTSTSCSWLVLGRASEGAGQHRHGAAAARRARPAVRRRAGRDRPADARHRPRRTVGARRAKARSRRRSSASASSSRSDWYVGYERGLNATAGSWQLIYRLARRLTVRARRAATTRST